MDVVFFNDQPERFLPLTYTRPLATIRVGILPIEKKWATHFKQLGEVMDTYYLTPDYLAKKYPNTTNESAIYINERFLPSDRLAKFMVENLIEGEAFFKDGVLVCAKCSKEQFEAKSYIVKDTNESFVPLSIDGLTDLFSKNGEALELDYELLTKNRKSQVLSDTNTLIGHRLFIEEGAQIEGAILNATEGPIYIGKNAEVMEGALIRGGFALCKEGVLKMGAKIYGPTTVGAFSKVGGEVNNCVIQDYSNKGHDGFIGNSIIGSWCNLGADTNTSNLKNNYGHVRVYSHASNRMEDTGLQFCGLIMADHAKCGINTMFNTGTVVGVSANVFDAGFPPKHVPSFSWGGKDKLIEYKLDKMFETAERVMQRRNVELTTEDKEILTTVFEKTAQFRK